MTNFIGNLGLNRYAIIPLLAGVICTFPLAQMEARGDRGLHEGGSYGRGNHEDVANGHDNHGHEDHEGYEKGYEHGYNHGYEHGYNHGYGYGYGAYVGPGVGVGIGLGGVGLEGDVNVYEAPVQPVYYAPQPGVHVDIN
jgi:hypothetical protein